MITQADNKKFLLKYQNIFLRFAQAFLKHYEKYGDEVSLEGYHYYIKQADDWKNDLQKLQ